MARAFLRTVADHIYEHYKDSTEKLCIVLPNKRGAIFLKSHLAQSFGRTIWLPSIISGEDLVAELSGLRVLEEIDLVCHLYESYKVCYGPEAESFDSFARWGQLILHDFNEIDRYLADPAQLYENLKDIKDIENWSLGREELSPHQQAYLRFMGTLGAIYRHFTSFLLANRWAYPGLAYRTALANVGASTFPDRFRKIVFCGFNALSAAELRLYSELQRRHKAELLWDADRYYLDDPDQEAGQFLRENLRVFGQKEPLFVEDNFRAPKDIRLVSVPRQMGQAQVVKQSLQELIDAGVPMERVAVVLANEKLLWPVLQQLPAGVGSVNVTMEYPLRYTSTYGLIDLLLQLQFSFSKQQKAGKTIYHKELLALLRHPLLRSYLRARGQAVDLQAIISQVTRRNLSFVTQKQLQQLFGAHYESVRALLQHQPSTRVLCAHLLELLQTTAAFFAEHRGSDQDYLELEYLQVILKSFNRLSAILDRYPHFSDIQSFRQLYTQVLGSAAAPFIGEPLRGLQVMGMLETRTLDFDHIILVSVNEGVLPSGRSNSSFIPNDLKAAFGMPLYLEKDAIYAYHFYRLLQRARQVVITYDSETDAFGKGEKSRFLTQLQLEMTKYNPGIRIREEVAAYAGFPEELANVIRIAKSGEVLAPLLAKAGGGDNFSALSPSALLTFKDCSLRFYFRYSAGLREADEVEESAEASTFGSILHLSLEHLYKHLAGAVLSPAVLKEQLQRADEVVNDCFLSFFDGNAPTGKSLLQQEVLKVYVKKLVSHDIALAERLEGGGRQLGLRYLEQEFQASLPVEIGGQGSPVFIKGKIDRVDDLDGLLRVIDYKSSVKESDRFMFSGFESLFNDRNYNKQLQLFIYAWLLYQNGVGEPRQLRPCIIPFKVFSEEPRYILGPDRQPLVFSSALLDEFGQRLRSFIASVFDVSRPFLQTDDRNVCEYCAYNLICNRVTR